MANNTKTAPPPPAPQPLVTWPAQSFLSTVRVGIDRNGDIWQLQGSAGVVKVGTGAVPQVAGAEPKQ